VEQGYLWNAGIFLFKASTMLKEFQNHAQDTLSAVSNAVSFRGQVNKAGTTYHYLSSKNFEKAPKDLPIDTAIMEKSSNVAVLPCGAIGWHDVGSLSAIWDMADKCGDNNAVIGSGFAHESKGLLIYSTSGRKIVGSHIQDLMIVDTNDALIVIPRHKAQEIKQIVDALKSTQEAEVADTRAITMPWGEIQQISRDDKVLVSLVKLGRGGCFDRSFISCMSETWTVASGEIDFIRNGHTFTLGEGKSISFDDETSVVVQANNTPASCIVVCKLRSTPRSLGEIFATDVETDDATLRVA
jgi:mannose-6-phosphate isomerase-like protein (cupin superfamily)